MGTFLCFVGSLPASQISTHLDDSSPHLPPKSRKAKNFCGESQTSLGQGAESPLVENPCFILFSRVLIFFLIQGKIFILIEQRKVLIKPKNDMNFNLGNVHYVPSPTLNTWCVVGNSTLTRVMFLGWCWHDSVPCFQPHTTLFPLNVRVFSRGHQSLDLPPPESSMTSF